MMNKIKKWVRKRRNKDMMKMLDIVGRYNAENDLSFCRECNVQMIKQREIKHPTNFQADYKCPKCGKGIGIAW